MRWEAAGGDPMAIDEALAPASIGTAAAQVGSSTRALTPPSLPAHTGPIGGVGPGPGMSAVQEAPYSVNLEAMIDSIDSLASQLQVRRVRAAVGDTYV